MGASRRARRVYRPTRRTTDCIFRRDQGRLRGLTYSPLYASACLRQGKDCRTASVTLDRRCCPQMARILSDSDCRSWLSQPASTAAPLARPRHWRAPECWCPADDDTHLALQALLDNAALGERYPLGYLKEKSSCSIHRAAPRPANGGMPRTQPGRRQRPGTSNRPWGSPILEEGVERFLDRAAAVPHLCAQRAAEVSAGPACCCTPSSSRCGVQESTKRRSRFSRACHHYTAMLSTECGRNDLRSLSSALVRPPLRSEIAQRFFEMTVCHLNEAGA